MTADYPLTGPEAIEHALSRIDLDELEAEQRQIIVSKKKTARPRAVRLLGIIAGLRKNQVGAGELMLKSVPVIPPKFRPFSVTGDTFLPGDANEMYRDLLEYRRLYQKTEESLGREGSGEVYGDLVKAVRATYGFGDSPNPKTHARGVKGFFQTVTGTSPKTGFFQSKMLSKPVDTVARGVIIPDAEYDMNEIGLPAEHAWKLYGSYIQRRLVRSGIAPAAALRHVKDRTPQALKALESEMTSRPVVATRSPAWHKFNVIGANPKIVEGDAIRINTWVTDGLTADFDGDSVDLETPITLRHNGRIAMLTGRELERLHSISEGDEIVTPKGYEAWTYSGWSPVVNFSFHKCAAKKKFRVTLRNGVSFIVSEDHSIMVDKKETKPEGLTLGTSPDVAFPPPDSDRGCYEEGVIYGHFMGDGCAEIRNEPQGSRPGSGRVSIACKPDDEREYLKELWTLFYGQRLTDCGHGWLQLTDYQTAAHFLMACGRYCLGKKIHPELLSKSPEFLKGMLAGYILSDGSVEVTRSGSYLVRTWSRSKPLRDAMSLVASMLGLPHSLRERTAKGEVNYIISFGKEAIKEMDYRCVGKKGARLRQALEAYANDRKTVKRSQSLRGHEVVTIEEVVYSDRMIDLEVKSGEHVFTILGGVVLHNTMSIHLPSTDAAIKDVRERMMPDKMLWSVKNRDSVVPTLKHEQQIGVNLGGTQPLKNKVTFANDSDAMRAIESGQVDLNDDIDIDPSYVPAAPTFAPGSIDR